MLSRNVIQFNGINIGCHVSHRDEVLFDVSNDKLVVTVAELCMPGLLAPLHIVVVDHNLSGIILGIGNNQDFLIILNKQICVTQISILIFSLFVCLKGYNIEFKLF